MAKNLKALSDEEKDWLNNNYNIIFKPDIGFIVNRTGYDRRVIHDAGKKFILSTPIRKITISKLAQDLWVNKYQDKYTLIDVQSAISTLIVTYQDLSDEDINKQLQRASSKIKEI